MGGRERGRVCPRARTRIRTRTRTRTPLFTAIHRYPPLPTATHRYYTPRADDLLASGLVLGMSLLVVSFIMYLTEGLLRVGGHTTESHGFSSVPEVGGSWFVVRGW